MTRRHAPLLTLLLTGGLTIVTASFTSAGCADPGKHGDVGGGGGGSSDLSVSGVGGGDDDGGGSGSGGDDGGDAGSSNVYGDLGGIPDAGVCAPGQTPPTCNNPLPPTPGCGGTELCGAAGSGNGLDDNCNGQVDEICPCTPGDVERCFLGPPGKHLVGACTDGTQTCEGAGEFTQWGACKGSIGPSPEVCDKLDNDCNGCPDDGLCCDAAINCPAPGNPRIAPQTPYTNVPLKGELFFPGTATSWNWTIHGGPCDRLFETTTGSPPSQSFTLTGANTRDANVLFTLSGDYTVTLTVVDSSGHTWTCTWVQHILGPGVRFELCWDVQGGDGADLDLHIHRPGTTTKWFENKPNVTNPDDCDYQNCRGANVLGVARPAWGYGNSPLNVCVGGPEGPDWMSLGYCANPRLDIDNIDDLGKPENTNIDQPKNGDTFRSMVHYYTGSVTVHPLVNIYCGGNLKATYGQAPNLVSGFNNGQGWNAGQIWRVADVKAIVDPSGVTTDCTVTALHPATPAGNTNYWVTTNDMTY